MPNGRAITIPGPDSGRWAGFSSRLPSTDPMLRATGHNGVSAWQRVPAPRGIPQTVSALPYALRVDDQASVTSVAEVSVPEPSPAEPESAEPRPPSLSPSRAADFMTCPLL